MKKLILYITIFALIFACCGCGKTDVEASEPSTVPSQSEVETEPTTVTVTEPVETKPPIEVAQQPMTAVYLPIQTDTTKAEDGTAIFIHMKQNMVLIAEDPDVADRVVMDFLNRTNSSDSTQQLVQSAKQIHAAGANGLPLWAQCLYNPQRVDRNILSLYGFESSNAGAAHANTSFQSVTYDMLTGKVLSLNDILTADTTGETLCKKVIEALEPQSASLFPDYQMLVEDLFRRPVTEYNDWYFSTEGLCFYFSPYEIASYAAGDIVATIPYSSLAGILEDAYFPPERDLSRGKLIQSVFDPDTISQFSQIAEVTLSENGKKVILNTDYSIHDIRIIQKTQYIGNPDYTEEITLFATESLTPGDAVLIQLPDSGSLSVTYTTNGQIHTEDIQ